MKTLALVQDIITIVIVIVIFIIIIIISSCYFQSHGTFCASWMSCAAWAPLRRGRFGLKIGSSGERIGSSGLEIRSSWYNIISFNALHLINNLRFIG